MIAYRKRRNAPRKFTAVRLAPETLNGLDELRRLFAKRWPTASYPTLSYVLEELLTKSLKRLADPRQMELEVADFKARYAKAVPTTAKQG